MLWRVLALFLVLYTTYAQDNWQVIYDDQPYPHDPTKYRVSFAWDHNEDKAIVLRKQETKNPMENGGACDPAAGKLAKDGSPYWLPRFFKKEVPKEVTEKTGITHANVDWQPCGHKDIVICHGESHYDFHLYYQDQDHLDGMKCDNTADSTGDLSDSLICRDETLTNHKFFNLMGSNNIPETIGGKRVNFCMDPTSGIPRSGMHYGDRAETLQEWRSPVTLIGSHDCKITFFEPMLSWRWIGNLVYNNKGWPLWKSGPIEYKNQTITALPKSWQVEVSSDCYDIAYRSYYGGNAPADKTCRITVTTEGTKCPTSDPGCRKQLAARHCAPAPNCIRPEGELYTSPSVIAELLQKQKISTDANTHGGGTHGPTSRSSRNISSAKTQKNNSAETWRYGHTSTHYFCHKKDLQDNEYTTTVVYGLNDQEGCRNDEKRTGTSASPSGTPPQNDSFGSEHSLTTSSASATYPHLSHISWLLQLVISVCLLLLPALVMTQRVF